MGDWKGKLKKFAKWVLPAAAAITVGTVFPPAAGAVATAIKEGLSKFGLSVDSSTLKGVSEEILKRGENVDDIFEKLKKSLLEQNKMLEQYVTSAVEYSLRGVYSNLMTVLQELKDKQELLDSIIKEMGGAGVVSAAQQMDIVKVFEDKFKSLSTGLNDLNSILSQANTLGLSSIKLDNLLAVQNNLKSAAEWIKESAGGLPFAKDFLDKYSEFEKLIEEAKSKGLDAIDANKLSKLQRELQDAFSKFQQESHKILDAVKNIQISMADLENLEGELGTVIERLKTEGISAFSKEDLMGLRDRLQNTFERIKEAGLRSEYAPLVLEKYEKLKDTLNTLLEEHAETIDLERLEGAYSEFQEIVNKLREEGPQAFEAVKDLDPSQIQQLLTLSAAGGAAAGVSLSPSTAMSIVSAATKIPGIIQRLRKAEYKLDNKFKEGYSLLTKKLDGKSVLYMSLVQLQLAQTSSKYDINYDPELYVHRRDAESRLDKYAMDMASKKSTDIRNVFLVLADAGIGKTWLLAHTANKLIEQKYPVFFISLRLGFDYQLENIFNTKLYNVPNVLSQINDVTKKPTFLILDGLDEVTSTERSKILRFVASLGGRKDVAIILSCRLIDWISDPAISDHFTTLNRIIYTVERYEGYDTEISIILNRFSPEEVKLAIEKYGLPELSGELLELAKLPFIISVLSSYYDRHGRLPDPKNIDEFLEFMASPKGHTVFNRVGIRDYARDILLRVIDKFIMNKTLELPLEEVIDEIKDREVWARIISSSLLEKKETTYGTTVRLSSIFGKYLVALAVKRKRGNKYIEMARKAIELYPELKEYFRIPEKAVVPSGIGAAAAGATIAIPKKALKVAVYDPKGKKIMIDVPIGDTKIYRNPVTGKLVANINNRVIDLGIIDATVSRNRHLLIRYDGENIVIMDEGSTNGTFVNGRRIPSGTPIAVKPGDIIMPGFQTKIAIESM